jgi:hypothetical protein
MISVQASFISSGAFPIVFYVFNTLVGTLVIFFLVGVALLVYVQSGNYMLGRTTSERYSSKPANSDND